MEWIIKLRMSVAYSSVPKATTKVSWYCFGWGDCPTIHLLCGKRLQDNFFRPTAIWCGFDGVSSLFEKNQPNGSNQTLQLQPRQVTSSLSWSPSLAYRLCVVHKREELIAFCYSNILRIFQISSQNFMISSPIFPKYSTPLSLLYHPTQFPIMHPTPPTN